MNSISSKELFTSIVATLPYIYVGLSNGFSSEYIYENSSNKNFTENEESLIGSSGLTFSFISCLASGYLVDEFGRKIIIYFTYAINAVGWMIISKTEYVLIGRFVLSLGVGGSYESSVYMAEILQPHYRGIVLNFSVVLITLGDVLIYFSLYYFSVEIVSFVLSICAVILFVCTFLIPETPYWYMLKNKKNEAVESLLWLRKTNKQMVDDEINKIEESMGKNDELIRNFIETVFNLRWLKYFSLFLIYVLLSGFMGFDVIIAYAVQFFAKFNRTEIDNQIIANTFVSVTLVGSIVTVLITEKFDRISLVKRANTLNLFLFIFCGICAICFNSIIFSIFTLIMVCIYGTTIAFVSHGLPWTMISENLPTDLRATIFASLNALYSLVFSFVLRLFPIILDYFRIAYIFLSLALFSLLNYIFVHNFVKETKNVVLS